MTKNEIILITLISLIESESLSDTVFTHGCSDGTTLFETLLNEISCDKKVMDEIIDQWQCGDDKDLLTGLKMILGLEKDCLN